MFSVSRRGLLRSDRLSHRGRRPQTHPHRRGHREEQASETVSMTTFKILSRDNSDFILIKEIPGYHVKNNDHCYLRKML